MDDERKEGKWTAEKRFLKFTHYLNEAADHSENVYAGGKNKNTQLVG